MNDFNRRNNTAPVVSIVIVLIAGMFTWSYAHPETLMEAMGFLVAWVIAIFLFRYIFMIIIKSLGMMKLSTVKVDVPKVPKVVIRPRVILTIIALLLSTLISMGIISYISVEHPYPSYGATNYSEAGDFILVWIITTLIVRWSVIGLYKLHLNLLGEHGDIDKPAKN